MAKKKANKNTSPASRVDKALGMSQRNSDHPLVGKGVRHKRPDGSIEFGEIMAVIDMPVSQGDLVLIERVYQDADSDSYQVLEPLGSLADSTVMLFNDVDDAIAY